MKKLISKKKLREFGFLISIFLPLFFGFLIPLIFGHTPRVWILLITLPMLFITLFFPLKLLRIYQYWMFTGKILGWINSKLVLGLIFIIVLLPMALIMKIIGYDPLKLKSKSTSSYKEIKKNYRIDLNKNF
tara:strand:- start:9150 stop:9542 length:393 start_codon:yes stop_codon:yes gene_type:complete